jgi:mannan endo-1,4-beta-mannosidase
MKIHLIAMAALFVTTLAAAPSFVQTRGMDLVLGGRKYTFVGANFWYGMNLGAHDRPRLKRDLNRFAAGTPVTLRDDFYAQADSRGGG